MDKIKKVESEPWLIPFTDRIEIIESSLKNGKKIVISFYTKADSSTFRYRGYNVMQSLLKSKNWTAVYFFENEIKNMINLISISEFIVLIRTPWSYEIESLVIEAKKQGKKIIFDVDDLIFDVSYVPLLANSLNLNLSEEHISNYWFSYVAKMQYIASIADGFIVTNMFLSNILEEKFSKPSYIIKNSLNYEQIQISEKICMEKIGYSKSEKIKIGYFSGSPTHVNDFNMIKDELILLMDKYKNLEIILVGYMDLPTKFEEYKKENRLTQLPFVNFIELQKIISKVDINIVPLLNNKFTNSKSELKYFEAAIVDVITVASPTFTYRNAIKNGENGFLANQGEWFQIISDICDCKYDLDTIKINSKKYCISEYFGEKFLMQIEDVYNKILSM